MTVKKNSIPAGRLSRKAEDYLEAIFNISHEKGYARIRDISKELGVKPPSVVEMVKKLDEQGYLSYKRYEGVSLTPSGEEIGRVVKNRHDTIKAFLLFIGVPEEIAEMDACTMEHHLDTKTVDQIKSFVKFVELGRCGQEMLIHFKIFCGSEKPSCNRCPGLRQAKCGDRPLEARKPAAIAE